MFCHCTLGFYFALVALIYLMSPICLLCRYDTSYVLRGLFKQFNNAYSEYGHLLEKRRHDSVHSDSKRNTYDVQTSSPDKSGSRYNRNGTYRGSSFKTVRERSHGRFQPESDRDSPSDLSNVGFRAQFTTGTRTSFVPPEGRIARDSAHSSRKEAQMI